jgi:hypothetical protein
MNACLLFLLIYVYACKYESSSRLNYQPFAKQIFFPSDADIPGGRHALHKWRVAAIHCNRSTCSNVDVGFQQSMQDVPNALP